MEAILIIAVIAIVVAMVIKKKKGGTSKKGTAQEDLEEVAKKFYTDHITHRVKIFTEDQEFYDDFYRNFMTNNNVPIDALYAMLEGPDILEKMKSHFKASVVKLCEAAEGNSVFINTAEGAKEFNARFKGDIDGWEQKQTQDIITILPPLALFLKCYHTLYTPWDKSFVRVIDINRELYKVMGEDNTAENHEKFHDACNKRLWDTYDRLIEGIWESLQEEDPQLHADERKSIFMDVAENNEEIHAMWIMAWRHQFSKIGDAYGKLVLDLYHFFEEVKEAYCPMAVREDTWLINFALDIQNPTLSITSDQLNADECQRILELYTSGKMKGAYYKARENVVIKKAKE